MENNDYYIQFSGKANIPKPLKNGESYKVSLDGEVTAVTTSNNQNGTYTEKFKFEPLIAEIIIEHGETIKAKDTRSNSVKIRKCAYAVWSQKNVAGMDFETFYDRLTNLIISNMDALGEKIT